MTYNCVIVAIIAGLAIIISQVNGAPSQNPLKHGTSKQDSLLLPSRVLFEFGTHVLQTGKVVAALGDGARPTFEIARTYTYDFTKEVCSENSSCETVQEFITIGYTNIIQI